MNEITELNQSTFESEVLTANVPVLVDFYAPWCGPCKMLTPVLAQLAGEFQGKVKFAKVDVDQAPGIAATYAIMGVPTLMIFSKGEVISQIVGARSPKALKDWLNTAIASPASVFAQNAN